MAIENINKGSTANDKTGTPLRAAADIINANFAYVVSLFSGYVTNSSLTTALSSYVTSSALAALNYVTNSSLATSLLDYATKSYADSLVVGLIEDRGSYNASSNTFPSGTPSSGDLGGSGVANAIMKGDLWFCSAAGNLGGTAVQIGSSFRALIDNPGQTASNWAIISTTLGFTPENAANKSTNINTDQASDTKYPSVKSVYDWATGLFTKLSGNNNWSGQQTFKETKDTVYTITDGEDFEIDPVNGNIQIITLGANRTPLATNFEAGQSVLLHIADGTAHTITWSSIGVVWVGGSAPALATTGYSIVSLWKVNAIIYGSHIGDVA